MTEFDPTPNRDATDNIRQRWRENTDTFGRVYDTILGITAPTPYADIAETAECSPNAAKKHLERLVEMGIAHNESESRPARYERNEGYLEWQEASRIATDFTVDEIIERVQRLEAHRELTFQKISPVMTASKNSKPASSRKVPTCSPRTSTKTGSLSVATNSNASSKTTGRPTSVSPVRKMSSVAVVQSRIR